MWRLNAFHDETGASVVFIGLWITVLVALVGFAVDVGAMFAERRELSRGADAAALAIAEDCVTGARSCDQSTALSTANHYADLNADDDAAGIHSLDLDLTAQRVTVTTKTIDADDGTDEFKFFFMRVLGLGSSTVGATAVAEWGFLQSGRTIPLIISDCEYLSVVGPDNTSGETTFYFHSGGQATDCNAQAGQDWNDDERLPGGFGWLETSNGCGSDVTADGIAGADPGASPSNGCSATALRNEIFGHTRLLAYFDDLAEQGAAGQYHIAGIGAFHVTGYNFGGQYKAPSAATAPCSGTDRCVRGYFTTMTDYYGDIGGPNRGVRVVRLVG